MLTLTIALTIAFTIIIPTTMTHCLPSGAVDHSIDPYCPQTPSLNRQVRISVQGLRRYLAQDLNRLREKVC